MAIPSVFLRCFRFLFFSLLFLLLACAPERTQVQSQDLQRVLQRVAESRIQTALASEVGKPAPSDRELFEEACKVYRLQLDEAKSFLQKQNPDLYEHFYGK